VKRFVFLLLIIGLLLCAQWITFIASASSRHAPVKRSISLPLTVASLKFYYKQDENARFIDLKTKWQTEHKGAISLQKAADFADTADSQASVEAELSRWKAQGGPAPKVFGAKLHLYNNGKKAIVNIPLTITTKVNVGDLRVSPVTQLTDYEYLRQTSRWETVSTRTMQIPVVAPGEDQLIDVAKFRLLDFLGKHAGQWPESVQVSVSSPQFGIAERRIILLPDHFVVPTLY
jgi:hypothetical protein